MASEWELGTGMEFGFGMGIGGTSVVAPSLSAASAHAPSYAVGSNSPAYLYGLPSADTLRIDDLLDFSNHEVFSGSSAAAADSHVINYQAAETSSVTGGRPFAGESRSHVSSFADDIYIPTEEAAELEWLSKFVEDSFSDVPYPASSAAATYLTANAQIRVGPADAASPGHGGMSKRSRAASTNFTPSLVPNQSSSSSTTSSSSSSDFPPPPAAHISGGGSSRKKVVSAAGGDGESMSGAGVDGGVRRCTHCASEKTPQWRTGPLGPKTLCNACGVRYKSGRLVPEYRPAASPTFVLAQHSNSHRKVMELRRKKEQIHLLLHENAVAGGSAPRKPEIIYHN